jgi:hypothetical protein
VVSAARPLESIVNVCVQNPCGSTESRQVRVTEEPGAKPLRLTEYQYPQGAGPPLAKLILAGSEGGGGEDVEPPPHETRFDSTPFPVTQ